MSLGKTGFFYGWVVVATGFLVTFVLGGAVYYPFGIFLKPMIADLGCSRGEAAIALSALMVVAGLLAPAVAAVMRKVSIRVLMGAGMTVVAVGLALLSTITQVWQLWVLLGGVVAAGIAFGTVVPATTMVNFWFVRRKSLAIGIVMAGVGVGTLVLAPVVARLIESLGWRDAWLVLAGLTFFLGAVPSLVFARSRPEDLGQLPDGCSGGAPAQEEPGRAGVERREPTGWGVRAALRTPALWLIAVFSAANLFAINMLTAHQVAHITDIGISPVAAAGALGLLVGVSTVGRLLGGVLGDRMKPSYLVAAACLMELLGLLLLMNSRGMGLVYGYVVLFGLSYGMILVLSPVMIAQYYGAKAYASLFATVNVGATLVAAVSPIMGGFVYDAVHSYAVPFAVCAGFSGVAAVCALLARPPGNAPLLGPNRG